MFKTFSDDFSEIGDELVDMLTMDIQHMADISASYVISASPVDSGLFKGNWNVSIDAPYSGVFMSEDPGGESTKGKMLFEIDTFTLNTDAQIQIQNNVMNPETNEHYASTVAWDQSGGTAERILFRAAMRSVESV